MAKSREYNFSRVILTLFVCLVPILGSTLDEKAVIYTSFCVLAAAWGFNVYKTGFFAFTKTAAFFSIVTAYSYFQLIWVSDKGSQAAFATLMLTCTVAAMVARQFREFMGDEIHRYGCTLVYIAALCYAVTAVFFQIFVQSKFWGCNMDMGNNSPTAAAFIMLAGIFAALRLFHEKRKTPAFFAALVLMAYVFVMTKSLGAFLCGAILIFVYTMNIRHKRVEAFCALVASGVLAVANIIYIVYTFIVGNVSFDATLRALPGMIGMGKGGYEAFISVVDGGYKGVQLVIDTFGEVYGVFGILLAIIVITKAVIKANKDHSMRNMFALIAVGVLMFTSSQSLVFMLPLFAMYYGFEDDGEYVKAHPLVGALTLVPISFFVMLTAARCFYAFGQDAFDRGKYAQAADWYTTAARMEIFNSEGWQKAYNALYKDYTENGTDNLLKQEECLTNASKHNKANYKYKRLIANVYTNEKRYNDALMVWDEIILKHDKEYLYPMYAQKICDVMKYEKNTLDRTSQLYNKIEAYAKKCTNMDIKIKVNNILTESQKYYVLAREGDYSEADMYTFDPHGLNEPPTDTGEDI
ncbi:MAG: hypothetical protein IJ316_02865 [Clostridia bacterium]|nr:hypothetical protein [Clostridia bacterium]